MTDAAAVWIVGRVSSSNAKEWQFHGVFATEDEAITACLDSNYFVGPAEVGVPVSDGSWPAAFYPIVEALR